MSSNIEDIISRQINNWYRIKSLSKMQTDEDGEPGLEGVPPRQPVVAFSRQLGSGSRFVTDLLSRRLGYEIFGCSLIEKVAQDIKVQRRIIDMLDEQAQSSIQNFVEGMLRGRQVDAEEYFASLLRVMHAMVLQGGLILLGRGSHFVVERGMGLRVRLIAPLEVRIKNLMEYGGIDRAAALSRIEASDRQRADFVRKFFKADIRDSQNYDLVLNMGTLSPNAAQGIILRALEMFQVSGSRAGTP